MPFAFAVPRPNADDLDLTLHPGEYMFVLGANGSGKSSLMQLINNRAAARRRDQKVDEVRRISAHRQTWFQHGTLNMTSAQRQEYDKSIQSIDSNPDSRWKDDYAHQRSNVALYDLVDAENVRARGIAAAFDDEDMALALALKQKDAPLKIINNLLKLSNLPIKIEVREREDVVAIKCGSQPYSIAELSDGERNALLIAANVLTVKPGTLLLIDEPERHLHRSIISPLLTLLFKRRPDCAFIVSTHEVMLAIDNPTARTLLLRGCTYEGRNKATAWDLDELPACNSIDETLMRDILGERRRIIFVEGTESSLDKPLYSLLFPDVSIVAKSTCHDVERAVLGIRDSASLHWIKAFGVIDNDGRPQGEIERFTAKGIYPLSVHAVESIYYHAEVQKRTAKRHASVVGGDETALVSQAKSAALSAVSEHIQRLSERVAERVIREAIVRQLPGRKEIAQGHPIDLHVEVRTLVDRERAHIEELIDAEDLAAIIARYPIRETPALDVISRKLGFRDRSQYESAVLRLLTDDDGTLQLVRSLFEPLMRGLADS